MNEPGATSDGATFRGLPVGVAVGDSRAKGRPGIEILRDMITGALPAPPISRSLNFWISEVSPGRAVFEGEPGFESVNPMGGVHGGWALTLIDSATSCAAMSLLDAGVGYTTVETKGNMVRAIKPDSGRYHCEAKILSPGRSIMTAEAQVTGPDGKLYARGTSTLMLLRP